MFFFFTRAFGRKQNSILFMFEVHTNWYKTILKCVGYWLKNILVSSD